MLDKLRQSLPISRPKAKSVQLDTRSLVYSPERPMGFIRRSDPAYYYLSRR